MGQSARGCRRCRPALPGEVLLLEGEGVGLHVVTADVVPLEDVLVRVPRDGHGDDFGNSRADEVAVAGL
jgi:hypothetical protein